MKENPVGNTTPDIVTIECPNCGAPVKRNEGEYSGRCPFCGTDIVFDEMKEEVQFTEMQNRINVLENQDKIDFRNRNLLKKWIKSRNIDLTIMTLLTFIGFTMLELSETYDNGILQLGPILLFLALMFFLFIAILLPLDFPGYIDINGNTDNSMKAKFKMMIKLMIIDICLGLVAALSASVFASVIVGS